MKEELSTRETLWAATASATSAVPGLWLPVLKASPDIQCPYITLLGKGRKKRAGGCLSRDIAITEYFSDFILNLENIFYISLEFFLFCFLLLVEKGEKIGEENKK